MRRFSGGRPGGGADFSGVNGGGGSDRFTNDTKKRLQGHSERPRQTHYGGGRGFRPHSGKKI